MKYYLLINCFSGQFGEIDQSLQNLHERSEGNFKQTEVNISPNLTRKQLISRLVHALSETLKLLNGFVNFDGPITVMTSFAVTSATKRPVT